MEHSRNNAIRQAVACREYEKARELWAEYFVALRREAERGTLTTGQMEEAGELFEWARVTMLCQRAQIWQRLRGLQVAGIYSQPSDRAIRGPSFSGKL